MRTAFCLSVFSVTGGEWDWVLQLLRPREVRCVDSLLAFGAKDAQAYPHSFASFHRAEFQRDAQGRGFSKAILGSDVGPWFGV